MSDDSEFGRLTPSPSPESNCDPESEGVERPSRHGAILGEVMASIAAEGRRLGAELQLPEMCGTCAFRPGCMTNQMAATLMTALNCVLGIDPDRFACHHVMKDGEPVRLCAGYLATKLAPWDFTKEAISTLNARLAGMAGPDEIREAFDAWIATVDPNGTMDNYQRGRAYLGSPLAGTQHLSRDGEAKRPNTENDPNEPQGAEG